MTPSKRLLGMLAETVQTLESGDSEAAAAAMQRVVATCAEMQAADIVLEPAALEEAKRLFEKCASAATAVQAQLLSEMSQASRGRRAAAAYRRR